MSQASLPWASMDEESRTEFWATLALRHAQGVGPRTCARLLQTFGSAYAAMQNMGQWAAAGISTEKKAQVQSGSWRTTARQEWDDAQGIDAHILLWHDPLYPPLLKQLPDAPPLLYYKGDISLLRAPAVAIVGSRQCTNEGVKIAATIARQLSACGITVVSGMALGIDSAAHRLALRDVGKSIAVLGTGIDIIYPKANSDTYSALSEQGLVLSEFAPHVRAHPANFPVRNRIISGLSLGVLVVEAAVRSGSLITARLALEQNREVYAIPGPVFSKQSEGCQTLIRQGARVIFSAEDIVLDLATQLATYGIHKADVTLVNLGPDLPDDAASELTSLVHAHHSDPTARKRLTPPAKTVRAPVQRRSLTGTAESVQHSEYFDASATAIAKYTTDSGPKEQTVQLLPALEGEAKLIYQYLQSHGKMHVDTLCMALNLPVQNVSSVLIELEINKYLYRLPGAWYCIHGYE